MSTESQSEVENLSDPEIRRLREEILGEGDDE